MNNRIRIISITCAALFFSPLALASIDVAIVNVTELFNNSAYVMKANKKLQDNVKQIETTLKDQQAKLQKEVSDYQKAKNADKKAELAKAITADQARLNELTKQSQASITTEQNKGMQEFTKLVQAAVQKIAKEKNIHTVLNNTSVIYSDNTWVDITKDVEAEMAKN